MTGFNLQSAKPIAAREDEGIDVQLRDENGEAMTYEYEGATRPVVIRVVGTYSARYRRAQEQQRNAMMQQRRAKFTGDMLYRQGLDLVARCILSWEGIFDGETVVPCTPENAVFLLDAASWIREQVEEAMNDHQGFLKTSSRS